MRLSDFDYNLPRELIAQQPTSPRDHSRLLIFDKKTGETKHRHFYDLSEYLHAGDVLVLNNSKVFRARLLGKKKDTGGKMEVFLLRRVEGGSARAGQVGAFAGEAWECLVGGRGARPGLEIEFGEGLSAVIEPVAGNVPYIARLNLSGKALLAAIEKVGITPLPPYIKREKPLKGEAKKYQTVYADARKIGSAAAPTAGLHFTSGLLVKLKKKGVIIKYITLHVGPGTFAPVKVDDISKHKMHSEFAEIKSDVIKEIMKAKEENRRVIAVGTTSARALETVFSHRAYEKKKNIKSAVQNTRYKIHGFSGWTDIFIRPPHKFKVVDALLTNFHLPKSTLLMLVSAFLGAGGEGKRKKIYKTAIKKKYRFFSYGDAMFIK